MTTISQTPEGEVLDAYFGVEQSIFSLMSDSSRGNSDDRSDLSKEEELRVATYFDGFITSRMELQRRILTISSAAIGLVLTIVASMRESLSFEVKVLSVASLTLFIGAVLFTMASMWTDTEYLLEAKKDITDQGGSDTVEDLESKTECQGHVARALFGFGVLVLLVLGIAILFA